MEYFWAASKQHFYSTRYQLLPGGQLQHGTSTFKSLRRKLVTFQTTSHPSHWGLLAQDLHFRHKLTECVTPSRFFKFMLALRSEDQHDNHYSQRTATQLPAMHHHYAGRVYLCGGDWALHTLYTEPPDYLLCIIIMLVGSSRWRGLNHYQSNAFRTVYP